MVASSLLAHRNNATANRRGGISLFTVQCFAVLLSFIGLFSSIQHTAAQYTGVTTGCGSLTFTPSELEGNSTMYFTAVVNDISSFEFRLIAADDKPIGWKELYDVDEDDDFLINYDCFVASTTDGAACGNSYVAIGETTGNYQFRVLKIGFQKCEGWSAATHSTDLRLDLLYRPTTMLSVSIPAPACGSLEAVVPTEFCNREGGAAALPVVVSLAVIAFVAAVSLV